LSTNEERKKKKKEFLGGGGGFLGRIGGGSVRSGLCVYENPEEYNYMKKTENQKKTLTLKKKKEKKRKTNQIVQNQTISPHPTTTTTTTDFPSDKISSTRQTQGKKPTKKTNNRDNKIENEAPSKEISQNLTKHADVVPPPPQKRQSLGEKIG